MDLDLKREIKLIIRQRCDELGLDHFDNEEIIVNTLSKQLKPEDIELAKMKQEISERARINQSITIASNSSQISNK